jgi:hypothetical protein
MSDPDPLLLCSGIGTCLSSVGNGYVSDFNCTYKCVPVKCPNYSICFHKRPQYLLNTYNGVCFHCHIQLKNCIFKSNHNVQCNKCINTNSESLKMDKCGHNLCVPCVRKHYLRILVNYEYLDKCPLIICPACVKIKT